MSHFSLIVVGEHPGRDVARYIDDPAELIERFAREGLKLPEDFFQGTKPKFDFCVIGGRWRGFFKLKSGHSGYVEPLDPRLDALFPLPPPMFDVDQALKGDVDWERNASRGSKTTDTDLGSI